MFPIFYHDSIGTPGCEELNVRIDVVGSQYILRAGQMIVYGITYMWADDYSFVDVTSQGNTLPLQGSFWSTPTGLKFVVIPEPWIPFILDQQDKWYQDFGKNRIAILFNTVSSFFEVATKKQTDGPMLLLNRRIAPKDTPVDQLPLPTPPAQIVPAVQDHPIIQTAKQRYEQYQNSPRVTARRKRWSELNEAEKEATLRVAAERLGLIESDTTV